MFYGLDPDRTYGDGKSISTLTADADAAGAAITGKVDACSPGGDAPGAMVKGGLSDFRATVTHQQGQLTSQISRLGANTSDGAGTAQHVQNESTTLQGSSASSSQATDTRLRRGIN